jgi:hypothetical protein
MVGISDLGYNSDPGDNWKMPLRKGGISGFIVSESRARGSWNSPPLLS